LDQTKQKLEELRTNDHPPIEPDSSECCGNGCQRCVWTEYNEALEAYKARLNGTKKAA
jgi:hypothetical protein